MCSAARKIAGPAGQFVAANAFEDRRAVVDDVRHDVNGRVVPVDQFAVVPDFIGLLDCHSDSLDLHYIGVMTRGSGSKPRGRTGVTS